MSSSSAEERLVVALSSSSRSGSTSPSIRTGSTAPLVHSSGSMRANRSCVSGCHDHRRLVDAAERGEALREVGSDSEPTQGFHPANPSRVPCTLSGGTERPSRPDHRQTRIRRYQHSSVAPTTVEPGDRKSPRSIIRNGASGDRPNRHRRRPPRQQQSGDIQRKPWSERPFRSPPSVWREGHDAVSATLSVRGPQQYEHRCASR